VTQRQAKHARDMVLSRRNQSWIASRRLDGKALVFAADAPDLQPPPPGSRQRVLGRSVAGISRKQRGLLGDAHRHRPGGVWAGSGAIDGQLQRELGLA